MNNSLKKKILNKFPFQIAILLGPLTYAFHHLEESIFGFREWRSRFVGKTNPLPSEYILAILMALYIMYIMLYHVWPNKKTAQIAILGSMTTQFHNAFYHLFGTIIMLEYSPGLVTGLLLYIPCNLFVFYQAYKENLINKSSLIIFLILGGVIFWLFEFIGLIVLVLYQIVIILFLVWYYFDEKNKK